MLDAFEIDEILCLLQIKAAVLVTVHQHQVCIRSDESVYETAFDALMPHVDHVFVGCDVTSVQAVGYGVANIVDALIFVVQVEFAVFSDDVAVNAVPPLFV